MAGLYDVCGFPPTAIDAFGGFAGTSVLLPLRHDDGFRARVMICGSFTDTPYALDLRGWNPSLSGTGAWNWHATGNRRMKERRLHACSVILPTGEIFVCGGIDAARADPPQDTRGVLMPEKVLQPLYRDVGHNP